VRACVRACVRGCTQDHYRVRAGECERDTTDSVRDSADSVNSVKSDQ